MSPPVEEVLDRVAGMRKAGVRFLEAGHVWEVDLFVADSPLLASALQRRRVVDLEGHHVPVLSPEDVILLKLVAGRRKDRVDVDEILLVVGELDLDYLRTWADRQGVREGLDSALRESGRSGS